MTGDNGVLSIYEQQGNLTWSCCLDGRHKQVKRLCPSLAANYSWHSAGQPSSHEEGAPRLAEERIKSAARYRHPRRKFSRSITVPPDLALAPEVA